MDRLVPSSIVVPSTADFHACLRKLNAGRTVVENETAANPTIDSIDT
jgi:hypothetical protein